MHDVRTMLTIVSIAQGVGQPDPHLTLSIFLNTAQLPRGSGFLHEEFKQSTRDVK